MRVGLVRSLSCVVVTAVSLLMLACGGGGTPISGVVTPPTSITVSATSIDFGNVAIGTTSTLTATLTNNGGQPVTVSAANVTGAGFALSGLTLPLTLQPQSSTVVSITFTPSTATASAGAVVITTSATATPITINLSGTGIVPPPITVAISPASPIVGVGGSVVLTATVANTSNTTVNWSSVPSAGVTFSGAPVGSPAGSISFSANAPGSYTVRATSGADPTKFAEVTVTVVAISISPNNVTMGSGSTQVFTATIVGGTNIPVTFAASGGSIVGSGNSATFTPPNQSGTFTVTASVPGVPSAVATATVNVVQFSISPASVTLLTSGLRTGTFTVSTNAPSPTVTFTATGGAITPSGLTATYTAPAAAGVYTLTASLDANPAITAVATITVIVPAVTVYEVDGVTQGNRPITFGRVFAQGDIPQCPQPVIGGTPIADYQADVKNRWPDGSVKFAIVSFVQTLGAATGTQVTFQSVASCNNSGFLNQAGMTGFNSGNWNAQVLVNALGSTTVTVDAKTMLAASDPGANIFGDCKNNYWQQGPVVTTVILQDCTAASQFDFGWSWNGTTMSSPVTGNAATASIHPIIILSFYPSINSVQAEFIMELPWSTRVQDQHVGYTFKTGTALNTVYTQASALRPHGVRHRKVFWSGVTPGQIRIDHNFPYMKFTRVFPNYDPFVSVSPDSAGNSNTGVTSWAQWVAGDKGDIGGFGGLNGFDMSYSNNSEGAPLQREELLYLYNMGTCGVANGACAKAWQMLTGESGLTDVGLLAGRVAGGAGIWNNLGNVPFHLREGRISADGQQSAATNFFYCAGFDDKNAPGNSTNCNGSGATNVATGRAASRHAHSTMRHDPVAVVGTVDPDRGGWEIGNPGCDHWMDYAFTPYLLTGSYFFLEEEYQAASYCLTAYNAGRTTVFASNGFFGFINDASVIRSIAWSLQTTGRAAFMAPDGTPEANYYRSMLRSNLEVQEGILNVTGTSLTPTTTNPSCSSYNVDTANRWDWGRCSVVSRCTTGACTPIPNVLHHVNIGNCPIDTTVLDPTRTSSSYAVWHYNMYNIALSHLAEMGFTEALPSAAETHKQLSERILDPAFNPYLVAVYVDPVKSGNSASGCTTYQTDQFIASYAALKAAYQPAVQAVTSFDQSGATGNFACSDHGYSIIARAAGSFVKSFATTSNHAGCPGGVCDPDDAWAWLEARVPYFNNTPLGSSGCGASDQQIKYALAPR